MHITTNFFRVKLDGVSPNALQAAMTALQTADPIAKNLVTGDFVMRVQEFELDESSNHFVGDFVSFRLDVTKDRSNIDGDSQPIQLQPDEGIGERTAFLYSPQRQVLLLQSNRSGVSAGRFADYFSSRIPGDNTMVLLPILRQDAAVRFSQMGNITKFRVKVAGDINSEIIANEGYGTKILRDLNRVFDAPAITLEVSVGMNWRQRSLSTNAVRDAANELAQYAAAGGAVSSVKVHGRNGDAGADTIDLVEDRMKFVDNLTPKNRVVSFVARRQMLARAYSENVSELRAMFDAETN